MSAYRKQEYIAELGALMLEAKCQTTAGKDAGDASSGREVGLAPPVFSENGCNPDSSLTKAVGDLVLSIHYYARLR